MFYSPLNVPPHAHPSARYTDSVMNSYQSMGVPPSASSFAQFYHQAAASAVSAANAGVAGMDSLGQCTQAGSGTVASSVASAAAAAGAAGLPDLPRYPWMALTGGNNWVFCFLACCSVDNVLRFLGGVYVWLFRFLCGFRYMFYSVCTFWFYGCVWWRIRG